MVVLGGVVAVIEKDGKHFMIQQALSKPFGGQWRHPGGRIEPNESPTEGAKREVKEETGMDIVVTDEHPLFVTMADYTGLYIGFFRAKCKSSELKIDKNEIADFGWFTVKEIRKLNLMNATKIFYEKHFNVSK